MTKESVRRLAEASGIHVAHKKGSRGICFIGKRPFGDFISQYVEPRRGAEEPSLPLPRCSCPPPSSFPPCSFSSISCAPPAAFSPSAGLA